MVSPYEVLQVDRDADEAAIQAAYRERVKETHPDHGGSASEFRLVQLAYEELQSGEYDGAQRHLGEARGADAGGSRQPKSASGSGRHRGDQRAAAADHSEGDAERRTATTHVEYLDYDAIADRGWDLCADDLFERAAEADLDVSTYGRMVVEPDEYLLEAAEDRGFDWPYSCRGGACANCAVAVCEGDLSMSVNTVLPEEQLDRGIRLSCIGTPTSDDLQVVFNVKHLPELEELRLPPRRYGAGSDD